MSDKKTLILIDGHALAFRQFFALERTGMKISRLGQCTDFLRQYSICWKKFTPIL